MNKHVVPSLLIASVLGYAGITSTQAAITITGDPGFPANPAFITVDPELYGPNQRNVAADRELRQTFQLDSTIEVGQLITGLKTDAGDNLNGGVIISIYEIADVLASSWSPGALVHSFTIPTSTTLPSTSANIGFTFSDSDVFTLPQRDTGSEGYGLAISNADGTSNIGGWRHTNDGTDHYTEGYYYSEGGSIPNAARDMGIAFVAVPEPSTYALLGLGALALTFARRRR